MDTPTWKLQARKAAIPPTPESTKPQLSPAAPASSAYFPSSPPDKLPARHSNPGLSSSPSKHLSAFRMSSTPASDPETPRARRNTSNRFWEKNDSRDKDDPAGIELASDSSDPDEDSEAALTKKLTAIDFQVKRLLVLETARAVRLKDFATNEAVKEYEKLLDAFAQKPRTKKRQAANTAALLAFVQEHFQITECYNEYAKLDKRVRKDRLLPEFISEDEDSDMDAEGETDPSKAGTKGDKAGIKGDGDLQRAPAKHALNNKDDSDEEGIVTQTLKPKHFDEASVFNTRDIKRPSIFGNGKKTPAKSEMNQRRFLLHKREGPLARGDEVGRREEMLDRDGTPIRPNKKRRVD